MPNFLILIPPLMLLLGAALAFYLWRTYEVPRRDSDDVGEAEPSDESAAGK